jgi:hypothetical protein
MRKIISYLFIIFISIFFSCRKNCEDTKKIIEERFLDVKYIPWVIPYKKDSTVYFLKNGFDTVAFTCTSYTQGYETIDMSDEDEGFCGSIKTEYIKAKLYAPENGDYFEIAYDNNPYDGGLDEVRVIYKNGTKFTTNYLYFSPYIIKSYYDTPINGKIYDSVTYVVSKFGNDTIMIKYPNSIIKLSVVDVYELLKIK